MERESNIEITQDVLLRFWEKVWLREKEYCWLWLAGKCSGGYGSFGFGGGTKVIAAHRFSFWVHYGKHPGNLNVLHTCDTPACVNPHHLFLGTQDDNVQDCKNKGRCSIGTDRPDAKLDDGKIKEIRFKSLFLSQAELSKEYSVSAFTISRIVRGKRWKHVKDVIS